MNRNRNMGNNEEFYENVGARVNQQQRIFNHRPSHQPMPINPNFLNPHYQNPVDLLRNYNRNGRINEPEENIYERLDDYEDEEEDNDDVDEVSNDNANETNDDENRDDGPRNENSGNPQMEFNNIADNHTYERIDNRPWYRGTLHNRSNPEQSHNLPSANFWNFYESPNTGNPYDNSRYSNLRSRALDAQTSCLNRLGRLGRNCFSSENIASATNTPRRYVYQLGHARMCQSCARFPFNYRDGRYVCHYCNNFHDRMRYYENVNSSNTLGNARHYIYQVSRSCRCPFCRGDYHYARFPIGSSRITDTFRRDCQCRNGGCTCRGRLMSSSNSAIYIGRLDRVGLVQTVNNPLYSSPTIYIGRIDRSCTSGLSNASTSSSPGNPSTSTESSGQSSTSAPMPSTSGTTNNGDSTSNQRAAGPSSVCQIAGGNAERQHVCDDSCIRSHPGNVTGVCQFLGRSERQDCHNGRVSLHWWFVNRWLPSWGSQSQNNERNPTVSTVNAEQQQPRIDEPREHQESDTEESRD